MEMCYCSEIMCMVIFQVMIVFLVLRLLAKKVLVVTYETMNFQWKDHRFNLHVPEDISKYSVNIKALLAGQFEHSSLKQVILSMCSVKLFSSPG